MNWLIWLLLLGGTRIHLGGRAPVLLYFDFVLIAYVLWQFAQGFWFPPKNWVIRLGVFLLVAGTLSAIVHYWDMYKSLAALQVLAVGLLVYAIARTKPPEILVLSAWGAAAGVLLILNFLNILYVDFRNAAEFKDAVETTLGRSNYVASMLIMLIPLGFAGISSYKGKKRLACMGFCTLMLIGLLITMSRGAILALLLAFVLSIPFLWRVGLRWKQWIAIATLAGVIFFLIPADQFTASADPLTAQWEDSDTSRMELMAASWRSFKSHALLGVGPGQLGSAISHEIVVPYDYTQYMNAHNLVLNALAEYGLPGFAILAVVAIVLRWAWLGMRKNPNVVTVGLFIALLAAVLHNMVEASFEGEQFQVIFWTVAAMAERHAIRQKEPGCSVNVPALLAAS